MKNPVVPAKAGIQVSDLTLRKPKNWIPAFAGMTILFILAVSSVSAAGVALVYENEAAAKQGKFTIASVVPEGILVPAQLALKSGANLLVGPVGNSVYHAALIRLDNDLDLAVLKLGEPVNDNAIQSTHQMKSKAVMAFMPQASSSAEPVWSSSISTAASRGLFAININDMPVESGVVTLKTGTLRKSQFNLDIIVNSTAPVWNIAVDLKSDPKLSFWKQGRHTGLNDIPRPNFSYEEQALFTPLKDGKMLRVPVEAHYIDKDKTYIWTIHVKSKMGEVTQTANIKFE